MLGLQEKIRTFPEGIGPSSVVRSIEHGEIWGIAKKIISHFSYSGFGSIDFIIQDQSNVIYVIELNPRPVPTSHLGRRFGEGLSEALSHSLTGKRSKFGLESREKQDVALFPSEFLRDPRSEYIENGFHDVPFEDPSLLDRIAPEGFSIQNAIAKRESKN